MLQSVANGREPGSSHYSDEQLPQAATSSLLNLRELRAILRRRAKIVIGAFAATLLAVLLYALIVPAKYTAAAIILSDPRQERVTQSDAVLPGIGTDIAAVESQVELLTSTELIERVMQKLGLFTDPEFTEGSFVTRTKELLLPGRPKGPEGAENEAIERFRKDLDVARRGLTYVLEVGFTSTDAAKSARIANALTDTYLDDQIRQKTLATEGAGAWLKTRIDELRASVNTSERAVADFKAEHGIVSLGTDQSGQRLDRQQLDQVNQELIEARAAVAGAAAKVEQMKRLVDHAGDLEELAAVQDSPIIQELRKQYAQMVGLEASYAETLGPEHPTLQRLRSQKARLQGEIKQEAKRVLAAAINEQETARIKGEALTKSLEQMTQQLEANDQLTVQLKELQRQAEADNALYVQFLGRAKEVSGQESMQKPDARIIARATPPTSPKGPGKLTLMGLAGAGGTLMALLAALLAEQLDTSYRTRSQLEDDLGIPCLALFPLFVRSRWRTSRTERLFSESIHLLLHEIEAVAPAKRPVVVLLSSALHGEGKSTIAKALADGAARASKRSLLIDANAKAGSLSQRMAPKAKRGLFDVLRGDVPLEEVLIQHSDFTTLLPAGRARGNALGSLTSSSLAALWAKVETPLDLVVIDGPPILASVESVLLQECADLVLLVVAWGRTSRDDVIAARDAIRRGRKTALDAVLNKVDPRALRSSSYV